MNIVGLYTLIRKEVERTFRVSVQTLVAPWISAVLYILIFGLIVGQRIDFSETGVSYIDFVLPGILMMSVITSAFTHSSSSLYFARFMRNIDEVLVAPLSYFEMIIGHVVGAVTRAVVVGVGIFVIALFFDAARIEHFGLLLFYIVSISAIFSLLGILTGLWANGFEQLNILSTFVLMPLNFLGGVFYSITMLPSSLKGVTLANPIFYFIDGIRYAMIGVRESNYILGYIIIVGLVLVLGTATVYLFKKGWRIRM